MQLYYYTMSTQNFQKQKVPLAGPSSCRTSQQGFHCWPRTSTIASRILLGSLHSIEPVTTIDRPLSYRSLLDALIRPWESLGCLIAAQAWDVLSNELISLFDPQLSVRLSNSSTVGVTRSNHCRPSVTNRNNSLTVSPIIY